MPPTTRILVRRDLKQAGVLLDRIMTYLARSGALYEEVHPPIYNNFCSIITIADGLKISLDRLRESL